MTLYAENLREPMKKLIEAMSTFSKVARYKLHTQNSLVVQYTSNEQPKKEIKIIPFIILSKRIKYLGINLTKELVLVSISSYNKYLR